MLKFNDEIEISSTSFDTNFEINQYAFFLLNTHTHSHSIPFTPFE